MKIEESGKKKKKRKKAGVVTIAESADVEESHYIEKVNQMHGDLDLETPDKETEANVNITEHDQSSEKRKITDNDLSSEGETSSVISLTMELPVTETVLQRIITDKVEQSLSVLPEAKLNLVVPEEITVNGTMQHEERTLHHKEDIFNAIEGKTKESDLMMEGLDSEFKSDGDTVSEQSSVHESILTEDACTQVVESQLASQNPFEGLVDDKNDHDPSDKVEEEEVDVTNDTYTTEHFAALAAFECGTPKQVDSMWQIEKDRALSNTSHEGEDLNIIPGIHKNTDRHSLSGSSGSFNGSGSFPLGSQRSSRNNTIDSVSRSSPFGSSAASDSWLYRSGSSSRTNSKPDAGFNVGSPESEFSEYEMFDELLGLEEDHFSPPEVHTLILILIKNKIIVFF